VSVPASSPLTSADQAGRSADELTAHQPVQIPVLRDPQAAGERLEAIAERTGSGQSQEAAERVEVILEQVRTRGDAALLELSERFDGVRPDPLRIPAGELEAAWADTPADLQDALRLAHRRILEFHQRQKPADIAMTGVHGEFARGDVIAVRDTQGLEIARGLANYSSAEARLICRKASSDFEKLLGYTGEPEMVHRTNLVLSR
jgi:histidinol dehydrogenase